MDFLKNPHVLLSLEWRYSTRFKVFHNESVRVVLDFYNCLVLYSYFQGKKCGFTYLNYCGVYGS